MTARPAAYTLLLANFVVGLCVLLPAGMLNDLSAGLGVTIAAAGLLVTWGAVVLCFGSPLVSWATSTVDRRTLLAGAMALLAAFNLASAFAPSYQSLLLIRLVLVAIAAPVTPQIAGTIALLVPPAERARAIAFVFLGWTLSVAAGLPLATWLAATVGWRASYGALAAVAAVAALALALSLPRALYGAAMSLKSWGAIARNRQIVLLLLVTALQVGGQFAVATYLAPLLVNLAGAAPGEIALFFFVFGAAGAVGNVAATRMVATVSPYRTSVIFLGAVIAGLLVWTLGAGVLPVMAAGVAIWGLGFAAINSMQQARLVAADPALAAGSVSLNTSMIYVGQALGSALGGLLLANGLDRPIGWLATGLAVLGLGVLLMTRKG